METIAIYGGSFDPPHLGHLETALSIQKTFHFDHFFLLPCKNPVLKAPSHAPAEQRLHMLELLLLANPSFKIDSREIQRNTPSYIVETLESYRNEQDSSISINLIMGMDAFLQLPQWHKWKKILKLSNLLVMERAQIAREIPPELQDYVKLNEIKSPLDLKQNEYGKIIFFNAGTYPVSSTKIRELIQKGNFPSSYLLEDVANYIKKQGLYL